MKSGDDDSDERNSRNLVSMVEFLNRYFTTLLYISRNNKRKRKQEERVDEQTNVRIALRHVAF
jgi:hypothetical protein